MFHDLVNSERRRIKIRDAIQIAGEIVGIAIISTSIVAIIVLAHVLVWN